MSARDKLNEAQFFLTKFKEAISLQDKRYFFGAFVSAWRSVTFVLQKDYRGNLSDKFDNWYDEKKKELRKIEAAGTFLKLRTILQKEGNKYPQLVIEAQTVGGDGIEFIWDPSRGKEGLVKYTVNYAEGRDLCVLEDEAEDHERKITEHIPVLLAAIPEMIKTIIKDKQLFCIGDDYQAISLEEVIKLCEINLKAVSDVVEQAEKKFGYAGSCKILNKSNAHGKI